MASKRLVSKIPHKDDEVRKIPERMILSVFKLMRNLDLLSYSRHLQNKLYKIFIFFTNLSFFDFLDVLRAYLPLCVYPVDELREY